MKPEESLQIHILKLKGKKYEIIPKYQLIKIEEADQDKCFVVIKSAQANSRGSITVEGVFF